MNPQPPPSEEQLQSLQDLLSGKCNTKQRQDEVRKQRGKLYGEPGPNHENIGLVFTGILQSHYQATDPSFKFPHPIPSHIVCMMMVGYKEVRAARSHQPDSHLDAANYNTFADELQRPEKNERA